MSPLTKKILDGDEQAVENFYHMYSPRIFRYLKKKLPEIEAAEIMNDVFLQAIDSLQQLRQSENLSAWLYKIAHHKMVDFYRKKKIKTFLFSQIPYLEVVATEINQPEFQWEKNRVRDGIEISLLSLSTKYRQILRMHYEEQIPVKEIALVLNLSFKATESRLYRARQSFIKAYERN